MCRRIECLTGLFITLLAAMLGAPATAGLVPGDFDGDCDVDVDDFGHFRECVLGPAVPQTEPGCADVRLDQDEDVDLDDFGVFQRCYSGNGIAADPNCNGTCVGPGCDCLCGQTDCNGTCTCVTIDNTNCGTCGNVCATGTTCSGGACLVVHCAEGLIWCDGACRDPQSDPNHCGGCGVVCPGDMICTADGCVGGGWSPLLSAGSGSATPVCPQPSCQPGSTLCGQLCVDLMFNNLHCGTCGHQCAGGETCSWGRCYGVCVGCE